MKIPRWLRWRSGGELDEEIQAHLEFAAQAGIERGLTPEEARYAARREMGNVTRVQERARERDPLFLFENVAKDIRYALRSLRRNPGFTIAAVLSLALGISVNCTIFSFADALLLRPLDVRNPGEIVQVYASTPRDSMIPLTQREYAAYRDRTQTLAGMVAETSEFFAVQASGNEQTRIAFGQFVSGNYFSLFGVEPALGRGFLPEEDSAAVKDIPALLSYPAWQSRFQSDPRIVGRRIKVDGAEVTIAGVLPQRFLGTNYFMRAEVYLPLAARTRVLARNRYQNSDPLSLGVSVWGRLKSGVSAQSAQAEFAALAKQAREEFPGDPDRTVTVLPDIKARLQQDPDDARLILVLLGIAGAVLLVACLNVANLLLGRASARLREIAIRQSVGAGRGRLIAQMLTESAVLAALAMGAGLLLAGLAIGYYATVQISPAFTSYIPVRLDGRVFLYAAAVSLCALVLSSLWPAIRASRVDLVAPVKRAVASFRGRYVLVAAQTALATMLLVSAALFVKSFILTSRASPGFRVDNVLIARFDPSLGGLSDEQAQTFYRDVADRVRELPGVRSAAWGSHLPMGPNSPFWPVAPQGAPQPTGVMFDSVEPDYFATMAVPILAGRGFDENDRSGAPGVAIVNQALADRFWPKGDAIGQKVRFGQGRGARTLEVVGIAGNGKYQVTVDQYQPYIYLPNRQHPNPEMTLFVYTAGDPAAMAPALRAAVNTVSADVPVHEFHTMREIFEQHGLMPARLMAQLVGTMGAIGLALGALGLYAVIAFAVTRRTREIGVRMALGATAPSILRSVLTSGVRMTLAGVAAGILAAYFLTRYVAEFLDRVGPRDALAFAGVPLILLAAALAACWIPARRASRVDPAVTLRYE